MKRVLLIVAVLFLAGVASFTSTANAGTVTAENAVIDDPGNWTAIESVFETSAFDGAAMAAAASASGHSFNPTYATDQGNLWADTSNAVTGPYSSRNARLIAGGITEGAERGGIGRALMMAGAEYLPIAVTVGSGALMGWQIGGAIDHWLHISEYFGNTTSFPTADNYVSGDWVSIRCNSATSAGTGNGSANWNDAGGNVRWSNVVGTTHGVSFGDIGDCADAIATYGLTAPFVVWMGVLQRPVSTCTGGAISDPLACTWDNNFSCTSTCAVGTSTDANMRAQMEKIQLDLGAANVRLLEGGTCTGGSQSCHGQIYMTQAQMNRTRSINVPGGTTNPGGTPIQVRVPAPINSTCVYASTCGTTIRTIVKTNTITRKWIVHEIRPDVTTTDPAASNNFTILQPIPNETYTDYIVRLQAAGWVGDVTFTAEPTPLTDYGPLAVTRLQYVANDATTKTLDPLRWPATVPAMKTDTPLIVRYNPSTVTPAPTDTGSTGAFDPTGPDEGSDNCASCAINWTPLESLDVGTKFPFGVPTWVSGIFGDISFADSCPSLSIGKPAALGGGSISIPFCSAQWEDTYRPIVFPILEAVMTLAAVALMGVKIFGIGGGGGDE